MSRANTIQKMIMGIDRMQLGGLWLKYAVVANNDQQQKPSSVSRSADRRANNSRLTAASKRASGGAIMPVLSHSKVNTNDKGKYLTIEQAAR
jgi:preprotein translocase subunit SecD